MFQLTNSIVDWDLEDLKAMERSTLREFVCKSQLAVLQLLWDRGELPDNNAFNREHDNEAGRNVPD